MKLLLILGTLLCFAKGEEHKATLKSLMVTSDIKVRYASTMVSAEYYNERNAPAVADFIIVLPERAYISNFSMEMNGEVSVGEVKEKAEARKIFAEAIKRGESAGHLSIRHRNTKNFKMSVNVEPNVKVVFNLTYEELLKRTHGNYSHKIFLTNEIIDKMLVEVFISEPQEIKVLEENLDEDLSVRSVDYIDNKHVYIKFDPSRDEQQKLKDAGYNVEFTVEYDVDRSNSNVIYTLDDYFVHFFAPDDEPVWPRNVVFMIDVSGSMMGRKLRQVKEAMHKTLSTLDLNNDTYTIGTFSNHVKWQQSHGLEEAEEFIKSLHAKGGTNINEAMVASLGKFEEKPPSDTADILFFLTDGDPTVGITNKDAIIQNIKNANKRNVLIFTLGFGEDCDLEFLRNIAANNNGFSRKIYIDKDSGEQINDMFNEVSSVLLKNVIITYVGSSIDIGQLTKNEFKTIFKGSEIAIAGPLKQGKEKSKTIITEMKAENAQRTFVRRQTLEFLDEIDDFNIIIGESPTSPNLTKLHLLQDMTKRTWAYLKLKNMLVTRAPKEDIVALALEHGFVTPLTSMVVTKKQLLGEETEEGNNMARYEPSMINIPTHVADHIAYIDIPVNGIQARYEPSMLEPAIHVPVRRMEGLPVIDTATEVTAPAATMAATTPTATMTATTPTTMTATTPTTMAATTPTTIAATTPTTMATTTPTSTIVPDLPIIPAIIVKPAKCPLMLCVSQEQECFNGSKVLILKDSRADVEIYGEAQKISSVTCINNLYKITIKSRGRVYQITPTSVKINRKTIDIRNRDSIRLSFKKFLRLEVFFNRNGERETISMKFFVQDYMKTARGLYSQFMKRYDCAIHQNTVSLSHMSRKFNLVTFASPKVGLDQCYM